MASNKSVGSAKSTIRLKLTATAPFAGFKLIFPSLYVIALPCNSKPESICNCVNAPTLVRLELVTVAPNVVALST